MNKELDERLIPNGEYIDALNIRIGSTEEDEMGVVETALGNIPLTDIQVQGVSLSTDALCIGAFEDGTNETIYWFVHDSSFPASLTGKLDLILAFNTEASTTTYHVISMKEGAAGTNTTLNFNPQYLITGVNKVENLLFFTDDINPPRRINITKDYGSPDATTDVDGFTDEEILVIKKPPSQSPSVVLTDNPNITSTFLEERFICFAYRWRYADNEYSATSQFSDPAFIPEPFNFTSESYLNEGMINKFNTAAVTFSTGGPLVLGIDLLFKEADDSTIKVIEKLDKEELGYGDNNNIVYNFSDSKIFTILPESEILRLYDNVPKLAKAQTIMGNRLMYGNYEEGYDLIDLSGNPTQLEYVATLRTTTPGELALDPSFATIQNTTYTLPVVVGGVSVTLPATARFDLSSLAILNNGTSNLTAGSSFEFNFSLEVDAATYPLSTQFVAGAGIAPSQLPPALTITATFILAANYDSVEDFINSSAFQNGVGLSTTILPVSSAAAATSCSGGTFTDNFNCAVPQSLGGFPIYTTGINSSTTALAPQPIIATHVNGTNSVEFTFPGLWYARAPLPISPAIPTDNYFVIYEIKTLSASYTNDTAFQSLHSNRGYEVGLMYMDDYGRSTTALVSPNNAIQVPCENSDLINSIRVEVPALQHAPSWATRYKFGIKPDRDGYNTIYANIFFVDGGRNLVYILLQGENSRKVSEGDRLIVKTDTNGAVNECDYVTVLEKGGYTANDIPSSQAVGGTYMVMESSGLALNQGAGAILQVPELSAQAGNFWSIGATQRPFIFIPFTYPLTANGGCASGSFDIPVGSIIKLKIDWRRNGKGSCDQREYNIDNEYTATENYSDLEEWFVQDGIAQTLINTSYFTGQGGPAIASYGGVNSSGVTPCPDELAYSEMTENDLDDLGVPPVAIGEFRFSILKYTNSDQVYLTVCGSSACGTHKDRKSFLSAELTIIRANELLVFETLPQDSAPDLFYESASSYSIDTATGFHNGNVQNQTASVPAIVDTSFYNCYSFLNGIESYKIRDSVEGKPFALGNRATSTAGQDYKKVRRYADITYSGVYNQESNINKLNEFNLGLLNFKPLEQSFGYIQKMFARETDILILQEDKISYVLSGKNLLSDAVGGGAVTSVPQVLGTQIARIEEFGISQNPESFAEYGPDKYFTDAKRGAVLQLRGTAGQNEALAVISDRNMSTWFRELFQVAFEYQKLGGYDPYAEEYVLSSNLRIRPSEDEIIPCGTTQTYVLLTGVPIVYTVDVGGISESFNVVTTVISGSPTGSVSYGDPAVSYPLTIPGTTIIPKPTTKPTTAVVTLMGAGTIQITVECPQGTRLNVIQVCLTSANDANALIHNEFSFSQGGYTSTTQSTSVQFSTSVINPIVSQFDTFTGYQGEGVFPSDGSSVVIASNKIGSDTYVYETADELLSLRTAVSYPNTAVGINALLVAASPALVTVGTSPYVSSSFVMPAGTAENLYLIYDYRDRVTATNLCYDAGKAQLACCCPASGTYYLNGSDLANSTGVYTTAALTTGDTAGFYSDGTIVREQTLSGVLPSLGVAATCGNCLPDCGTILSEQDAMGIYTATIDLDSGGAGTTGAVVIKLTPTTTGGGIPVGILASYDGVEYNKLSSANFGQLESSVSTNYTVVGTTASDCLITLPSTEYYLKYLASGFTYAIEGGSEEIAVVAGDINTTATVPGMCVMVIPRLAAAPSTMEVKILAPCKGGSWYLEVECPAVITATLTSSVSVISSVIACTLPRTTNHYFVHTDGTTGGGPQLYSYVFIDANGATPAMNGWISYIAGPTWWQIQDGIIIATAAC
tara:strand:+ start:3283 stop:8727 length:5445 start_codon:yes stop_codon:yes gene_type:complete